jgi:cellobiose phosphorylase
MIAGRDAKRHGEAKNSWLTGTAAWTFYNISRFILGIKPEFDGLIIDPCIPETLHGFTVTRKFRGDTFIIEVDNTSGVEKGIRSITIDGIETFNLLIASGKQMTHHVRVIIG